MIALALLGLLFSTTPTDDGTVSYHVSFDNAAHHEARISVSLTGLSSEPLELCMSRSSPGRYALHAFAKNVYSVSAVDGAGKALELERPNNHEWHVPGHDGSVTLSYTLFADRADGTYSQIDQSHAHLNMPATFMWPRGFSERAYEVSFEVPEGSQWRAATQLFQVGEELTFRAPTLQYFLDSPTELSAFDLREWQVAEADGRVRTIRMAIHHTGSAEEVDEYVDWTKKIVAEQHAVFGELPDFEGDTYTFIADYLPQASRDGMEHRNSTILSSSSSLAQSASSLIRTVSHEFFHSWNVERIRPASLEPFDFERANMSRELWFAEGFTSYYDKLFLRRAGLLDDAGYVRAIAPGLIRVLTTPALAYDSPVGMSLQAPFVDAATSVDPHNRANTFISYYTIGSTIGLALDLTLRSRFGRTLDDFMRLSWERYGRPEEPYDVEDLERLLGEFVGDQGFSADFFDRYVRGQELPDYAGLLRLAGIKLYALDFDSSTLDYSQFRVRPEGVEVLTKTLAGSALYRAGLEKGALITSFNGQLVNDLTELKRVIQEVKPGARLKIEYLQRGVRGQGVLVTQGLSGLQLRTYEEAWEVPSDAMKAFRAAWLGSRAGH